MSAVFLVAGGVFIDLMTTAEEVRGGRASTCHG
jgi:hypothetical protein